MSNARYDHEFWERLWAKTLVEHADKVARRPPSSRLTELAADLEPGRALDAGCGHGAEALWLAAHGWQVTAVDFSTSALEHGRATAEAAGEAIAERIDWVEGDLTHYTPHPESYDLVVCLFVHVPGSVPAMVQRLAGGVAPGGRLFMVGHLPIDPATGANTMAAGQVQVSVDTAVGALDPRKWTFEIAEDRTRTTSPGADAVICAFRAPGR